MHPNSLTVNIIRKLSAFSEEVFVLAITVITNITFTSILSFLLTDQMIKYLANT